MKCACQVIIYCIYRLRENDTIKEICHLRRQKPGYWTYQQASKHIGCKERNSCKLELLYGKNKYIENKMSRFILENIIITLNKLKYIYKVFGKINVNPIEILRD